jgi:hypothetical protein
MATSVSPPFSIQIAPPLLSGQATWIAWDELSYAYGADEVSVGDPTTAPGGAIGTWLNAGPPLANYSAWQMNVARKADLSQVARLITPVWGAFFTPVWDEEFPLVVIVPG